MFGKIGNISPSKGLLQALDLPEVVATTAVKHLEQHREQFRSGMEALNRDLQTVAAQGSKAEFKPFDAQRNTLFEAFQKVSVGDPAKIEKPIKRLLTTLNSVQQKASELAGGVASGREQWLQKEPVLDAALLKIGELEDQNHPKSPTLRKIGETIRKSANNSDFSEAVKTLDAFQPKLDEILAQAGK